MSDKARGYAHRVDIVSDVQRVWSALVDPAILTRWCSPKAQIRGQAGGVFRASVDRVIELEAHIDVFEPTRRMRLIYLPTPSLPPTDSVIVDDFILEPEGNGTILRLLGSGYPATVDWDVTYMRLRTGWQQALARLKVYVEKHLQGSSS
ncbi:MAG TPA: SRPBCC domain-containing protein [Steroidobacteraceae bacterium]|nr:SRPBCC domain-containing protein [Steroidobacteraceae bacterium]